MLFGKGKYTYELVGDWAKLPENVSFVDIGGLSIDSQDRLYVLNRGTLPVMVFDREGNLLSSWGEEFFSRPHGSCLTHDGFIYCTDDGNHTVSKFTLDGKLLMTMGEKDQPSNTGYINKGDMAESLATIKRSGPPFNRPTGVALSPYGDIYVTDGYGNARVHKFAPDGTLLFSWGEPGTGPGQFQVPHSIRIDEELRVWVCDRENSRIQIFDLDGKFLEQWDDIGGKPCDIFFGKDDMLYIPIKSGNKPHGVSIFTKDGELITRWGSQGAPDESNEEADYLFVTPHAIAVDSHGDIYVGEIRHNMAKVDRGSRALQKFVRKT
jgi:DNA-binding beta-propeller fold protein YncE